MLHQRIHLKDVFPFLGENGRDPVLTTYLPEITQEMRQTEQIRPALLIIPGGGYYFVSSREAEPVALNFLTKGYRVFVLNYSVKPHTFPVAIREVAAAMELIWEKSQQWAVDTSRVAILGFSAGGHLAGHYSNRYDCKEIRDVFPDSKPVKATVLCYPVITADHEWRHTKSFLHLSGSEVLTSDIIAAFSLNNMVSEKTPPTFIWHTREDKTVPVMNSLLYAQALTQYGVPFSLHIYPFGPHGLSTADYMTHRDDPTNTETVHQWMDEVAYWLKEVL